MSDLHGESVSGLNLPKSAAQAPPKPHEPGHPVMLVLLLLLLLPPRRGSMRAMCPVTAASAAGNLLPTGAACRPALVVVAVYDTCQRNATAE